MRQTELPETHPSWVTLDAGGTTADSTVFCAFATGGVYEVGQGSWTGQVAEIVGATVDCLRGTVVVRGGTLGAAVRVTQDTIWLAEDAC